MKNKFYLAALLLFSTIVALAQTTIIIPPKKDSSGITQVYQKKRQQVVAKQKSMPRTYVAPPTKVQGISVSQIVDLGLSVKWAGWNLGANAPEQKGGYYGWADPQGTNRSKDKNQYPSSTPPGSISGTQYDTARKLWGSNWRMPNAYEMLELYNECKWEWMIFRGIYGAKVTGPNGNAIFLPAAGYREGYTYDGQNEECNYWAGSLDPTDISGAFCVAVEKEDYSLDREFYPEDRHLGFSIRPVYDSGMPLVDIGPEEFQNMGMAGADTSIANLKITAVSSMQNGQWTNWDNSFKGTFEIREFTKSNIRTIYVRQNNVATPIAGYMVKNWGSQQSDGHGGTTNTILCMIPDVNGNPIEVTCTIALSSNNSGQFVCPINGVTYSFLLE